jgi:4-hydroxy-tetrahydrodipicolinate synthase
MRTSDKNYPCVWSASPTPFTASTDIDESALAKVIRHQILLGVGGLLIGGTAGEGPLLPVRKRNKLWEKAAQMADKKIIVGFQVTDNSYDKVLDNIKTAAACGADVAFVAEPWFRPARVGAPFYEKYYGEIFDRSPLPISFYIREILLPLHAYSKLLKHDNVKMIKDSSRNPDFAALALEYRRKRDSLRIFTGDEFSIADYLQMGYDGALAGAGAIIGYLVANMVGQDIKKKPSSVIRLQKKCNQILYTVYGGKKLGSTLTGLKYTLMMMRLFNTTQGYIQYPLPLSVKKRIDVMIQREKSFLLPYKE